LLDIGIAYFPGIIVDYDKLSLFIGDCIRFPKKGGLYYHHAIVKEVQEGYTSSCCTLTLIHLQKIGRPILACIHVGFHFLLHIPPLVVLFQQKKTGLICRSLFQQFLLLHHTYSFPLIGDQDIGGSHETFEDNDNSEEHGNVDKQFGFCMFCIKYEPVQTPDQLKRGDCIRFPKKGGCKLIG
jgi:hypothetical protein